MEHLAGKSHLRLLQFLNFCKVSNVTFILVTKTPVSFIKEALDILFLTFGFLFLQKPKHFTAPLKIYFSTSQSKLQAFFLTTLSWATTPSGYLLRLTMRHSVPHTHTLSSGSSLFSWHHLTVASTELSVRHRAA